MIFVAVKTAWVAIASAKGCVAAIQEKQMLKTEEKSQLVVHIA